MKLTLIQPGDVPEELRPQVGAYAPMFYRLFADHGFEFEVVRVDQGEPFPPIDTLDAVLVTGSAAGVYDDHLPWLEPLREFIRRAYAANTPMIGICFGHQVIAHALGGEVRKSEKGWGLGRHVYGLRDNLLGLTGAELAIACSHQDQVITPPTEAVTILASEFTPHAGLAYTNRRTVTFQPHPEFDDSYAAALVDLRRGRAPAETIETAQRSLQRPSDSAAVGAALAQFLKRSAA